jgi:NAD+ synthase (glutamine-hydrolysing)
VLLGLSGGIDSAVTLALAVDALGADRVEAVMMPSRYTADISVADSRDMADRLGIAYREITIGDITAQFERALEPAFAGAAMDTTEENLQARRAARC